MRFVAGRVHRGGEAGRGAVAKLLLAGAPWRRANREAVAGRGADADGWGLPGRDATIDAGGVAVKEWQWRRAGGVLILIKNSVALGKYLGICWIF